MKPSIGSKVLWAELLPHEFKKRLAECPLVYLPLGLCEPHGQVSAFGLDTIKAEWLCAQAARKVGGVVAPSMGYHIHETGYHARWLEEEIGEETPHFTGIPPAVMLHLFLYQLRAFVNAGFSSIVVITGHSGGNQRDLRLAADSFMKRVPVQIFVRSDPELVEGLFEGDHAGAYEISQLMYLRPDLIDMEAITLGDLPGSGGRLALAADAVQASPERGQAIMEACLDCLCREAAAMRQGLRPASLPQIDYDTVEEMWGEVLRSAKEWTTAQPWPEQSSVSRQSKWKPYERYAPVSEEAGS